jgi:hypothetical protein
MFIQKAITYATRKEVGYIPMLRWDFCGSSAFYVVSHEKYDFRGAGMPPIICMKHDTGVLLFNKSLRRHSLFKLDLREVCDTCFFFYGMYIRSATQTIP